MFNVTPHELTCVVLVMSGPSKSYLTNIEVERKGRTKTEQL